MEHNEFNWTLKDKKELYDSLLHWWEKHNAFEGNKIPFESMPNRIFSVYKKGVPLYRVAVYTTDSDMCWIGWITSNPYTTLKQRYKALEYLYQAITDYMSSIGYPIVISKTKQTGLMKTLNNTGFTNVEPLTNFYIKHT